MLATNGADAPPSLPKSEQKPMADPLIVVGNISADCEMNKLVSCNDGHVRSRRGT